MQRIVKNIKQREGGMLSKIEYINYTDCETKNIAGIDNTTLSTIMSEDCGVFVSRTNDNCINLIIEDENDQIIVNENIHQYAADSLAYFCKQYLHHYENLEAKS